VGTSWVCPELAGPGHHRRAALRAGLGTCCAGGDGALWPGLLCWGLPGSVPGEMKRFGPQLGLGSPPKLPPKCLLCHYECFKAEQGFSSTSAPVRWEQRQSGGREQALSLPVPCALLWGCGGSVRGSCPSLTPSSCGVGTRAAPWRAPEGKAGASSCSKAALQLPNPLGHLRKGRTGDTVGSHQRAEHEQ